MGLSAMFLQLTTCSPRPAWLARRNSILSFGRHSLQISFVFHAKKTY